MRITPFPLCHHIKADGRLCQSPARNRDRPQNHALEQFRICYKPLCLSFRSEAKESAVCSLHHGLHPCLKCFRMNILASIPVDSRICADTPAQSKQNKPLLPKIEIKMPMFVVANH